MSEPEGLGALRMLKPVLADDCLTGVLWATAPDKGSLMSAMGLYGPDGSRKESSIKSLVELPKEQYGPGRIAHKDGLMQPSHLKAWFSAENFIYSNIPGISDKPTETTAADLKKAAAEELKARQASLGDVAKADVIRWSSLSRLAVQMEKAGLKDEAKDLKAACKARELEKDFKNETVAFKMLVDQTNTVCNQRKAERDKAQATYRLIAAKYANTWAGGMASRMAEGLNPPPAEPAK